MVLIGQRRIMRKPSSGQRQPKQKRPRSRTLTAVHEAILEDLVYPTEIVGKHTRYRLDGSKICKVRGAHAAAHMAGAWTCPRTRTCKHSVVFWQACLLHQCPKRATHSHRRGSSRTRVGPHRAGRIPCIQPLLTNPAPTLATSQVYLDPKESANVEYKVDTFATVYKKLTGKEVKFSFPELDSH